MAIAKKHRRSIVHEGVNYVWWVAEDFEPVIGASLKVTVVSEDKKFLVVYYINQPQDGARYITVLGKRFGSNIKTGGVWKRFECPKFEEGNIFLPNHVVSLISWCLSNQNKKYEVNYFGVSENVV